MDFKSTINWDNGFRIAKVYPKQSKKGETYYMGDLNKNIKLTVWKRKGWEGKPDYLEIQGYPVKWEKTGAKKVKEEFNGQEINDVSF